MLTDLILERGFCICCFGVVWGVYIHISVGFCVARSDWVGNARRLEVVGRVTSTDSHVFRIYRALGECCLEI